MRSVSCPQVQPSRLARRTMLAFSRAPSAALSPRQLPHLEIARSPTIRLPHEQSARIPTGLWMARGGGGRWWLRRGGGLRWWRGSGHWRWSTPTATARYVHTSLVEWPVFFWRNNCKGCRCFGEGYRQTTVWKRAGVGPPIFSFLARSLQNINPAFLVTLNPNPYPPSAQ